MKQSHKRRALDTPAIIDLIFQTKAGVFDVATGNCAIAAHNAKIVDAERFILSHRSLTALVLIATQDKKMHIVQYSKSRITYITGADAYQISMTEDEDTYILTLTDVVGEKRSYTGTLNDPGTLAEGLAVIAGTKPTMTKKLLH